MIPKNTVKSTILIQSAIIGVELVKLNSELSSTLGDSDQQTNHNKRIKILQQQISALLCMFNEINTQSKSVNKDCKDCGKPFSRVEHYKVYKHVWDDAHDQTNTFKTSSTGTNKNNLCLHCLSERLNRPLNIYDFDAQLPINNGILFGFNMSLM